MTTCQGWLLHQDAVRCAAFKIRSMIGRGTASALNARHEKRSASNSSSTPIRSCVLFKTSIVLLTFLPRMQRITAWCAAKPGPLWAGPGSAMQRYALRRARDADAQRPLVGILLN